MISLTTRFVAEVSSNHNQSLNRCLAFVHRASDIGCWGIKFQYFKLDKLFHPLAIKHKTELAERRDWELSLAQVVNIAEECRARHIKLGVTPFHLDAVNDLYLHVDFYKIASYNILDHKLLALVAQTKKPVVVSTGMATMLEIFEAVEVLQQYGANDITLLHCVSNYPTEIIDCNLKAIDTIRAQTECATGWSDHSVQSAVIYRAVWRWLASMVEFHLDLDGIGKEYGKGHCWLPYEIRDVINTIYCAQLADGDGRKQPRPSELFERAWRADPQDGLRPLMPERWRLETEEACR